MFIDFCYSVQCWYVLICFMFVMHVFSPSYTPWQSMRGLKDDRVFFVLAGASRNLNPKQMVISFQTESTKKLWVPTVWVMKSDVNCIPSSRQFPSHVPWHPKKSCTKPPKHCLFFFAGLNGGIQPIYTCSYGHLLVISTKKTPFIECIIPFITSYNW